MSNQIINPTGPSTQTSISNSSPLKPLSSLLIANRGEIASRIFRTCRKMGIRSIAVFSEADRNMPFVSDADEAIFIGESNPNESYLNPDKIINAAKSVGADAIHPGYGFLSENAAFARRCTEEGIIWIGPHPEAISAMGSKASAKELMIANDVPVVPGYQGEGQSVETLIEEANKIGYPLLLKATAGGGGKGMRIVHTAADLEKAIAAAQRESLSAFGDDRLIVEKYVASGRHIEFQIFGDQHGNAIHLLERECTIQRRYQKVIEESPSPIMSPELRDRMGLAAVKAAKALGYDNAGTVEFIYDDISGDFYFLEVNTRLQVEHPVTEEITGLDLVKMQIESAQGMPLKISQSDIEGCGYAIEVRLYAENPNNDFTPGTGKVATFQFPSVEGLRIESAIKSGSSISIFYDPMIAKIIIHDRSRAGAHRKLSFVLSNMVCSGIQTNQKFLQAILQNANFQNGIYNTQFIEENIDSLITDTDDQEKIETACIAATIAQWDSRESKRTLLRSLPSAWRNSYNQPQEVEYIVNDLNHRLTYRYLNGAFNFGETTIAKLINVTADQYQIAINGRTYKFTITIDQDLIHVHTPHCGNITVIHINPLKEKEIEKVKGGYEAPMPAQIIKVLVEPGAKVKSGDGLVIISSMKMESTIEANEDGIVEEIFVSETMNVEAGALLLKMKEEQN